MKATKRILIKRGLEDLLRRLNYNGEITDNMFATLKREGGDFFHMRMSMRIFYRENKTFISLPIPLEIKMYYSWRWNQLEFRILVGMPSKEEAERLIEKNRKELEEYWQRLVRKPHHYTNQTWLHPRTIGIFSSKEEVERFEQNRQELEEYLKEDIDDPLKKEVVKTEKIVIGKKSLLCNYYTNIED